MGKFVFAGTDIVSIAGCFLAAIAPFPKLLADFEKLG